MCDTTELPRRWFLGPQEPERLFANEISNQMALAATTAAPCVHSMICPFRRDLEGSLMQPTNAEEAPQE